MWLAGELNEKANVRTVTIDVYNTEGKDMEMYSLSLISKNNNATYSLNENQEVMMDARIEYALFAFSKDSRFMYYYQPEELRKKILVGGCIELEMQEYEGEVTADVLRGLIGLGDEE
jgi:hypothetical protein